MAFARYLGTAALLSLAACGGVDPAEVLETVRATGQAQHQAIAARDLRGATRNYDVNAELLPPGGARVTGAKPIEAAYGHLIADPNLKLEVVPGEGWAAESGEFAVTTYTGTLTTTDAASGQAATVPITNQTVWRREDGVGWKIVSDHSSLVSVATPLVAANQE